VFQLARRGNCLAKVSVCLAVFLGVTITMSPQEAAAQGSRPTVSVTSPADGATYLIDPTLRLEFQTLRLRAVAPTRVTWFVDELRVAPEWQLARGSHTVTAMDEQGRRESVRIFVK